MFMVNKDYHLYASDTVRMVPEAFC